MNEESSHGYKPVFAYQVRVHQFLLRLDKTNSHLASQSVRGKGFRGRQQSQTQLSAIMSVTRAPLRHCSGNRENKACHVVWQVWWKKYREKGRKLEIGLTTIFKCKAYNTILCFWWQFATCTTFTLEHRKEKSRYSTSDMSCKKV